MTTTLIQALFSGIASGALYGLIALGLSLQFGVMKIINFAHGSFLMLSMFVALWLSNFLDFHPLVTIPFTAVVLFVVGYFTQRWLIDPIYQKETAREPISVLIFTTGLWIMLDHLMLIAVGPENRSVASEWNDGLLFFSDYLLTYPQLAGFIFSCLTTVALVAFLRYTRSGRAIRATGQDQEAAEALGVRVTRYKLYAAMLSAALTAIGGTFYAQYVLFISPDKVFGADISIVIAVICIIGGRGTLWGPILGAALLLPAEDIARHVTGGMVGADMLLYGILLMLVIRVEPQGLLVILSRLFGDKRKAAPKLAEAKQ